jgi:hypothetical protein
MKSAAGVLQPTLDGLAGDRCPWCDQPISHEKFEEIRGRIQAEERDRVAELERRLKDEVAKEKSKAEAKAKADVEAVRVQAAAAIDATNRAAAARVEAADDNARKTAELALAPKLAEAEKGRKRAEGQLQVVTANQEAALNRRLLEQRDLMEKAKTDAVNAERAKNFSEKLKFEEKLQQIQRQLQSKTADELGEGAELDLLEVLKEGFPEDDIQRVGKGKEGADIIQTVKDSGRECGCIVYDSKNRNVWRNEYVSKLRADQLAAKADHAILATRVLPAGARQMHLQDNVIVLNPARTLVVAEVLRNHILQMHTLRLSTVARSDKTAKLYDFIASDRWAQLLDQIEAETDHMLELDVKEVKAHESTWRRRGQLIRSVQRVRGELTSEVDRIIGGPEVVRAVQET